jgi:hypothetical protein
VCEQARYGDADGENEQLLDVKASLEMRGRSSRARLSEKFKSGKILTKSFD